MKFSAIIFTSFVLFLHMQGNLSAQNGQIVDTAHVHENQGIYLPEYYIETLSETKSHMQASNTFYKLPNNNGNIAIIVLEDRITFVYNFHESVERDIAEVNGNELIMEPRFPNDETKLLIDGNTIITEGKITFVNVNKDLDNWNSAIISYITDIIFGNGFFQSESGDNIFRTENGNITIGNTEHELESETMWYNPEYDVLVHREDGRSDYVFFRRYGDTLNIYAFEGEMADGPQWARFGKYTLVDEYRKITE